MVANLDQFFSGLTNYKKVAARKTQQLGYIEICPETGHKLWWWDFAKWKEIDKLYRSSEWSWEEYRVKHKGTGDEVCQQVKEHFSAMDKYAKLSLNSRTQGRGAIIFKDSGINLFNWIIKHDLFGKVKLCVGVHDEWNVEYPKELTNFPKTLETIMEQSAAKYCKSLPIPAEAEVGDHWIH